MSIKEPIISSVTANPSTVNPNGTSTVTCSASDPDGDPLTYSWSASGGSIQGSGSTVTWTAPSTIGTYTVTSTVSDGKVSVSKGTNITVTESTTPLSITTTSLSSGTVGVSYGTNLSATGGKTPFTWSIISGSLPSGLSLSTSGLISGIPTTAGTYNFAVQVKDSSTPQQTASKAFSITISTTPTFTLTINKIGTGSGTVTSTPSGINCGSMCQASFNQGQIVTLTATPATGSTFAGWSGACIGTGGCTVTMSSNQTVTATFNTASTSATFSITPGSQSVNEGSGAVTFTVTRSSATVAQTVYVSTTQTEGYTNSNDYNGISNQALTFAAGETSKTVTVTIINDSVVEPNEVFALIVQQNSSDPVTTYLAKSTFTIVNDDVVSTPTERITNGSFSTGPNPGWTLMYDFWAGTNLTSYRTSPGYAAGGVDSSGYAKNSASGYMYQSVTIPSNATTATLTFYYSITTNDSYSTPYDVLNVTIQNSSGGYLETAAIRSNANQTGGSYVLQTYTLTNVASYRGQTIRVNFLATTDSSFTTIFRIDDVSLMADGN